MAQVSIEVRVAGPDDVAAVSATGSSVFWDAYGGSAPDDDIAHYVESFFSEPAVAAEISRREVTYLVATENDRCAGFVKMRDGDIPALVTAESAIEVQQLYVSTDFQRRGIGRLLLDNVMLATRARSIAGVWLSVWDDADWATAFYLNYGFRSLGETPFIIGNTEFVDYLMWLPTSD